MLDILIGSNHLLDFKNRWNSAQEGRKWTPSILKSSQNPFKKKYSRKEMSSWNVESFESSRSTEMRSVQKVDVPVIFFTIIAVHGYISGHNLVSHIASAIFSFWCWVRMLNRRSRKRPSTKFHHNQVPFCISVHHIRSAVLNFWILSLDRSQRPQKPPTSKYHPN